jgi:hypothetical protein
MRIILYLLEYLHGNNPRSIRDIMVKSKSRSIYTMAKKGRNILEKVEKIPKKVISVGTVALGQNSSCRHCGARSEQWCVGVIYRLSILVSADVSQPIQKIIGIDYLMSDDTINHIFGIGCTMSVDTNNVSGIRGEILVCAVRLPKFPAICAAASLDAAPSLPSASMPPAVTPSLSLTPVVVPDPHRPPRPHLPQCHAIDAASLGASTASLNAAGSASVVVLDPVAVPDPVAPSPTSKVSSPSFFSDHGR